MNMHTALTLEWWCGGGGRWCYFYCHCSSHYVALKISSLTRFAFVVGSYWLHTILSRDLMDIWSELEWECQLKGNERKICSSPKREIHYGVGKRWMNLPFFVVISTKRFLHITLVVVAERLSRVREYGFVKLQTWMDEQEKFYLHLYCSSLWI